MSSFTEDQLTFRAAADDFAKKHFSLEDVLQDERNGKVRDSVLKDAHALGFTSLYVPNEQGKFPYDTVSMMMITERLCKSPAGGIVLIGPGLPLAAILRGGSPQQQAEIRASMVGEMPGRFAFALTEPGVGSDATQIRTKAVNDGDHFILNGTKAFITGAGYVKEAGERGYAVVMAQLGQVGNKQGIRAFIVRGDNPGYQVGPPYDKMGLHGSDTREVILDNCRVHQDAMIGIQAKSFAEGLEVQRVMKMTLDTSRPFVAALALGIASRAYDLALEAATKTKKIRDKPLIQFQSIRHTLAEMRMELETVAQLTYSAGRTLDRIFAGEFKELPEEESSMAKYLAADTAVRVCRRALEVFGGDGYMNEMGMSMYANAAAVFPIWEGTENIQLQSIARKFVSRSGVLALVSENRLPPESVSSEYADNLGASIRSYNLALQTAHGRGLLDQQAVQFSLARLRSQIEAGLQIGDFAFSGSSSSSERDYRVLLATAYGRTVADTTITGALNILGDDTAFGPLGIRRAREKELAAFGSSFQLLDRIAGSEDCFLLKPSGAWYK